MYSLSQIDIRSKYSSNFFMTLSSPKQSPKTRGNKLSSAELETRIAWVTELMVAGITRSEIITQCTGRYRCSLSTVERYMKGALRRLKACYKPQTESSAEMARRRFEKIFSAAMEKGDLRTAMSAQSNLCKLEGTWKTSDAVSSCVVDALTALMKEIRGQEAAP